MIRRLILKFLSYFYLELYSLLDQYKEAQVELDKARKELEEFDQRSREAQQKYDKCVTAEENYVRLRNDG